VEVECSSSNDSAAGNNIATVQLTIPTALATNTPTPTPIPVSQADVLIGGLSAEIGNPTVGQSFNLFLSYGVSGGYGVATNAVLTFSFPPGLVCADGTLNCTTQNVGSISPPGQNYNLSVGVRLDSGTPGDVLTINVSISAAESDPVPGNNGSSATATISG
jgi:hypothetical protein